MRGKGRLPVWIPAARSDGTIEELQVGYAVPSTAGFVLHLNPIRVGGRPGERMAGGAKVPPAPLPVSAAPAKVEGVFARRPEAPGSTTLDELERLARRCERVLADPKKARWHDDERLLLSEIRAELERKRAPLAG